MAVTFGPTAAVAAVVLTVTRPGAPATVHTPQPAAELFDQIAAYMTEHLGAHPPVNLPGSLAHRLTNAPTGTDIYDPATGATFRLDPADTPAAEEAAPIPVEIVWTHREGTRLTGLMFLGTLPAADHAAIDATGKVDQWQITGGTRRTTLDGFNDYAADGHGFRSLTPEAAARAAVDWLGFTGRPVALKITDETRL